ncbi:TolC family protein [candidate division FCPU426 bacterium]|nr:TolC family protein [candidate division FCPU426 bacterium]
MKTSLVLCLLAVGMCCQTGWADSTQTAAENLRLALGNNTELKQSLADLQIAEAAVEKTYAIFDWKLDGNLTYSADASEPSSVFSPEQTKVMAYKLSLSEKMVTAGYISLDLSSSRTDIMYSPAIYAFGPVDNPLFQPELALTYTQPLLKDFLGRPDRIALKIGDRTVALAKTMVRNTVVEQVAKFTEAYSAIVMARQMLAVQKVSLAESRDYYNQALRLKRIGMREDKDLLQTKAPMLSSEAEIRPAENNVIMAEENFFNLTGLTPQAWEAGMGTANTRVAKMALNQTLTEEDEENLINQQPLIQITQMNLEITELSKQIADNAAWPSLSVFGKYGITGLDTDAGGSFSEMFSNEYNNFALGINFTMFFPNRGSSGEIKTKTQETAKAREKYEELYKAFGMQIRNAHRTLLTAEQDYQLKVEARKLYEDTLAIQNRHFSQGRISTRELLMAQGDLHRAQFSEISAYYELIKAINTWKKMTGAYDEYVQAFIKE